MKLQLTYTQNEIYKMLLAQGPITLSQLRGKLRYKMEKVRGAVKTLVKLGVAISIADDCYDSIPTRLGIYIKPNTIPENKRNKSDIKVAPIPDPRMKISLTDKQRKLIIENKDLNRTALAKLVKMRKMDLCYVLEYELYKVGS